MSLVVIRDFAEQPRGHRHQFHLEWLAFHKAYAQPLLQPNSADSEVLLTLPPGGYTSEVTGTDGGTGIGLCAIYQQP